MSNPYITINHYTDSVANHVNISFYDQFNNLQGTYGANVHDMDGNPFNGLEGGVFDETNPSRVPAQSTAIQLTQAQWNSAHTLAYHEYAETSATGEGYYFLF